MCASPQFDTNGQEPRRRRPANIKAIQLNAQRVTVLSMQRAYGSVEAVTVALTSWYIPSLRRNDSIGPSPTMTRISLWETSHKFSGVWVAYRKGSCYPGKIIGAGALPAAELFSRLIYRSIVISCLRTDTYASTTRIDPSLNSTNRDPSKAPG